MTKLLEQVLYVKVLSLIRPAGLISAGTTIVGIFMRAAAISCPGSVLSQEARHKIPSSDAPSTAASISFAMRSRLAWTNPPLCPVKMKSAGAAVLISNEMPPALYISSAANFAIASR